MLNDFEMEIDRVLGELLREPDIKDVIASERRVPRPYKGNREIKLIVLGQDPTVRNKRSRDEVRYTLNLDRKGSPLHRYISGICAKLGLTLEENIYSTNLWKNFFTQPLTRIDPKMIKLAGGKWMPILQREIEQYPDVPVLTLGQPVLSFLDASRGQVLREYWGHRPGIEFGSSDHFSYSLPNQNRLERLLLPFPHQPTVRLSFYKKTLSSYAEFCNGIIQH